MDNYPTDVTKLAQRDGGPLVCHGCAHSAGGSTRYPGCPSGERPCCFCVRNVLLPEQLAEYRKDTRLTHFQEGVYGVTFTPLYDNKPVAKIPLDCYIATDYLTEVVRHG
jgi:hypothetical protein